METYTFECKRCGRNFDAAASVSSSFRRLLLVIFTLGFGPLIMLYTKSKCPDCGRHRVRLLITILFLAIFTLELTYTIYYFVQVAPLRIVQDASMTNLPDNVDLTSPVDQENWHELLTFVWIVGIMPTTGAYLTMYWPYILIIWFGILIVLGLLIPSRFLKKD